MSAGKATGQPEGGEPTYAYGVALTLISAVAFSLGGMFMRLIETDVWNVLFWRGALVSVLIFAYMAVRRGRGVFAAYFAVGWPGLLLVLCSATAMTCFLTSLSLTTVANNSVIYALSPFVTAALAYVFAAERPGLATLIAAVVAFAGVAITVLGSDALGAGSRLGDFLAFGMTFFASVGPVIVRKYRDIPMLPASGLSALAVALASLLLSRLVGTPSAPFAVSTEDMVLLALFALCQQFLGHLLYTAGARHIPAAHTALIFTLDAPLAPLWVYLAIGEHPGEPAIIGGAVVMAAVIGHILVTQNILRVRFR